MLNHFGMEFAKVVCTPLIASIRLPELNSTRSELEKEYMFSVPYASVIGSLMYVIVCPRSNLAQIVSVASRYMGNPRKEHWQVMKCIQVP